MSRAQSGAIVGAMHVVIVGGGVGALEGLLALQALAPETLTVTLVAPGRFLTYRALSVTEPFGGAPAPHFEWDAIARDRSVRRIPDALVGVRPHEQVLDMRDGPPVTYDALLLALGARPLAALPGALMFAGPRDVLAVSEAIDRIEPGRLHRIAFVAVAGTAWTLPLYELALLAAERGRRERLELALEVVTAEATPLAAFGTEASRAVEQRLQAAGIPVRTHTHAVEFEPTSCGSTGTARSTPIWSLRFPICAGPRSQGCRTTAAVSSASTRTAASAASSASGPWGT